MSEIVFGGRQSISEGSTPVVKCAWCRRSVYVTGTKYGPFLCEYCNAQWTRTARQQGLHYRYRLKPCSGCGRGVSCHVNSQHTPKCRTCREDERIAKTPVDTEKRDKRYQQALEVLSRMANADEYVRPLALIQRKLYQPGWWNSALEIMVAAELGRINLKFTPQKRVHRYRVDFYIKELNLVLEVDGSLFHEGRRRSKDKIRDAEILIAGHNITRIKERDIRDDLITAVATALKTIKTPEELTNTDAWLALQKKEARQRARDAQLDVGCRNRDEGSDYLRDIGFKTW